MAADYPSAIKTFSTVVNGITKLVAALFNSPYEEITAIQTELGTDPAGSVADVKTRLAVSIEDDGTLKDGVVDNVTLNTTDGEYSDGDATATSYAVTGGQYCFWPQYKVSASLDGNVNVAGSHGSLNLTDTSYVTNVTLQGATSKTIYAKFLYVTASGLDRWIFILLDKATNKILAATSAKDHPAYGNGGDFTKVPHSFRNYDEAKHNVILLDKDTCSLLETRSEQTGKSILTLVHEEFKPNMSQEEQYVPMHSGKFIKKKPELVQSIPSYIKVRKLIELTAQEKQDRKNEEAQATASAEQAKAKKEQDKMKAVNKLKTLGLS